ncbi:MAG: YeeE/YedE family protein [Amaricoccus sp.]
MRLLTAYLIGVVFGTGIALSGMIDPAKVLNFFDVAGSWDPSLAFVMGGALAVTALGYRLVFRNPRPILDDHFHLPKASAIDARLVGGAAIFGIGWGIAGFCPGGALPALGTGRTEVVVFVAALLAGILATRAVLDRHARTPERQPS